MRCLPLCALLAASLACEQTHRRTLLRRGLARSARAPAPPGERRARWPWSPTTARTRSRWSTWPGRARWPASPSGSIPSRSTGRTTWPSIPPPAWCSPPSSYPPPAGLLRPPRQPRRRGRRRACWCAWASTTCACRRASGPRSTPATSSSRPTAAASWSPTSISRWPCGPPAPAGEDERRSTPGHLRRRHPVAPGLGARRPGGARPDHQRRRSHRLRRLLRLRRAGGGGARRPRLRRDPRAGGPGRGQRLLARSTDPTPRSCPPTAASVYVSNLESEDVRVYDVAQRRLRSRACRPGARGGVLPRLRSRGRHPDRPRAEPRRPRGPRRAPPWPCARRAASRGPSASARTRRPAPPTAATSWCAKATARAPAPWSRCDPADPRDPRAHRAGRLPRRHRLRARRSLVKPPMRPGTRVLADRRWRAIAVGSGSLAGRLRGCTRTLARRSAERRWPRPQVLELHLQRLLLSSPATRSGRGRATGCTPGAPLAGATARPSYWGGAVLDLFEAVSACYRQFMRGGRLEPGQRRRPRPLRLPGLALENRGPRAKGRHPLHPRAHHRRARRR